MKKTNYNAKIEVINGELVMDKIAFDLIDKCMSLSFDAAIATFDTFERGMAIHDDLARDFNAYCYLLFEAIGQRLYSMEQMVLSKLDELLQRAYSLRVETKNPYVSMFN